MCPGQMPSIEEGSNDDKGGQFQSKKFEPEFDEVLHSMIEHHLRDNLAALEESFGLQLRQQKSEMQDGLDSLREEHEFSLAEWQRRLLALQHGQQQYATSSINTRLDNLEGDLRTSVAKAMENAREALKLADAAMQHDIEREKALVESFEKDLGELRGALSLARDVRTRDSAEPLRNSSHNSSSAAAVQQPQRRLPGLSDEPLRLASEEDNKKVAGEYIREAQSLSNLREQVAADLSEIRADSSHVVRSSSRATLQPSPRIDSRPQARPMMPAVAPDSMVYQPDDARRTMGSLRGLVQPAAQPPMMTRQTISSPQSSQRALPNKATPPSSPRVTMRSGRSMTPVVMRLR